MKKEQKKLSVSHQLEVSFWMFYFSYFSCIFYRFCEWCFMHLNWFSNKTVYDLCKREHRLWDLTVWIQVTAPTYISCEILEKFLISICLSFLLLSGNNNNLSHGIVRQRVKGVWNIRSAPLPPSPAFLPRVQETLGNCTLPHLQSAQQ